MEKADSSSVFLMHVNDLLHLVITPHEDPRTVVDVFGHDGQHSLHLAVHGLAARWIQHTYMLGQPWGRKISRTGKDTNRERMEMERENGDQPFSKIMAMGAHSYRIRSLPFGLFLSAG